MTLRVLDPTLGAEAGNLQLAPALKSLDGTVIGLLDNAKVGTERFFDFVAEILKREYGLYKIHPAHLIPGERALDLGTVVIRLDRADLVKS